MQTHTHAAGERIAGLIRGPAVAPQPPLAVSAQSAAKMLSISTRTLWTFSNAGGGIPSIRLGRRVLYRIADLESWLAAHATTAGSPTP